jgi:hypothetical protein
MIIFDLPPTNDISGLRALSLGSCRVTNPIIILRERGDLRLCALGLTSHHTAPEALQSLRVVNGELRIPDALCPYIFDTEVTPPVDHLRDLVATGIDAFILEVCADKQFSFGEILLQENFVVRDLVQPYRGALLGWFREVCRGHSPDEECIRTALENLRLGGFEPGESMAELLRGVRMRTQDTDEITGALGAMMSQFGGRWVVIGAFEVPGHEGAIMKDRQTLNAKLVSAARHCGAVFYDPTELLVEYGKATALDESGANIYEYAPSFYPTVGEGLVNLARTGRASPSKACEPGIPAVPASRARRPYVPSPLTGGGPAAFAARRDLAKRIDVELVDLHRGRLAALGISGSGLYPHYKGLVERGSLVGERERAVLDLVAAYLPSYDAYGVLRAGLGELALLLAAMGSKVIAFEPEPNRLSAIEAGRAHLEARGLLAPGALAILPTLTPEGPLNGLVLGIGLGVAHVLDEAAAAPLMERMRFFEALLIDLRAFLRIREDPADKLLATEGLRAMGFERRRDYPADGLSSFRKA